MSLKKELDSLKKEKNNIRKRIAEITSQLDTLRLQQKEFEDQVANFSARTSSLAERLAKKYQTFANEVSKEISIIKKTLDDLNSSLEKKQKEIDSREKNPTLYIQEQVEHMVSKTLEYIEAHFEEIGISIKRNFSISNITETVPDRYGDYTLPTGIICIYDDSTQSIIAKSRDFYFTQKLYDLSFDTAYYTTHCHTTDWFNEYYNKFKKHFLEELQHKYNYIDLKLTIKNSGFTLELV